MANKVEGEKYYKIDGQLLEIKRQLRQENGYPFVVDELIRCLQDVIEGNFKRVVFVGAPKAILTKQFDPAKFLDNNSATWKGPIDGDGLSGEEDIDSRGLALTEIEISKLVFETGFKKDEKSIKGEEKLRRQREMSNLIRLGGNAFLGLWENYQANKEKSVLEYLYRTQKITYLDFMGQILRGPDGSRRVLYLYRHVDGKWYWDCDWLGFDCGSDDPSACVQVSTQDSESQA